MCHVQLRGNYTDFLLPLWIQEIEFAPSCLCGKHFDLLSHLTGPRHPGFLSEMLYLEFYHPGEANIQLLSLASGTGGEGLSLVCCLFLKRLAPGGLTMPQ